VVAVPRDVERRAGDRLQHVEDMLDPLVLFEPPDVEQPRRHGAVRW
jgi:hypothetical protein